MSRGPGGRIVAWVAAHPVISIVAFFAVLPFVLPYTSLATQILVYGLFALGFNLLYGYTGLLSFGHAAYWGLGAYGTGIVLAKFGWTSLWAALAVGILAAGLGGAFVGFFALRRRGIYFAMLTLAFAQLFYFIAFHLADLTGGDDGLRGIPQLPLGVLGWSISIKSPLAFHYFALVIAALAVAGLRRVLASPFGAVLAAIRENGDRATACGYDVTRARHVSFVFSALITGLAGGLDALRLSVVPVEAMFWSTSGQVVIMTLLGGAGTFFGPFVGAATFLLLGDRLSLVLVDSWPIVIGAVFMAFVLFLPRGIWGTLVGGIPGR
jgi:branched-chain amino acid transport system permease protein